MTLRRTLQRSLSTTTRSLSQFGSSGGAAPSPLLLDSYPGAAAAYSLRRLNTAYTGPVVQVRRSGDSAEDTFSATEVGDGTLAAWVTAGGGTEDGFVKTWYDQSGNGYDASQAVAVIQPQIVASGAVVLENGEAAIQFANVGLTFLEGAIDYTGEAGFVTSAISGLNNNENAVMMVQSGNINNYRADLVRATSSGNLRGLFPGVFYDGDTTLSGTHSIVLHYSNGSTTTLSLNGRDEVLTYGAGTNLGQWVSDTMPVALDTLVIGAVKRTTGYLEGFSGKHQEIIIYDSDQSSNRTGIESNIASHYGITLS